MTHENRNVEPAYTRGYLQRAQAGIGALGDDEYAQLIKGGLDRLAQQLTSK